MDLKVIVIIILGLSNVLSIILFLRFKKRQAKIKEFKEIVNNSSKTKGIQINRDTIHGIKNSVSNIMTFIQILKREIDVDTDFREYFSMIQNSSEKILFLIDNILPKSTDHKSDEQVFIEPVPELPDCNEISRQLDKIKEQHLSMLKTAIMTLDVEFCNHIISEIAGYDQEAASMLKLVIKDYRFDLLQSVMERSSNDV